MTSETPVRGLDNVVVARSRLSAIDGIGGNLIYAGYHIHELAGRASFEEVVYLLWYGELPTAVELAAFQARLAAARGLSADELALVHSVPASGHGMDALRTLVSGLAQLDAQADAIDDSATEQIGVRVLATMPVLLAAWERHRHGAEPIAPTRLCHMPQTSCICYVALFLQPPRRMHSIPIWCC